MWCTKLIKRIYKTHMLLDCTAAKEFWSQASLRLAKGVKVSRFKIEHDDLGF